MAMTLLTNLKFEPKGRHDPAQAYNVTDTVTSSNGSTAYTAIKNVPAGIELSNTDYWVKILDLEDVRSSAEMAASDANLAAKMATDASKSGISTIVEQNLPATQKDMAQENIGLKEIVRGLTDSFEASGNLVQCNPIYGVAFDRVETQFFMNQEGEGDPSLTNIRPISGYDSLSLVRCGKSLFGFEETTFVRSKTFELQGNLPAGKYIFSATVASSDTDSPRAVVNFRKLDGSYYSTTILHDGVRHVIMVNIPEPINAIRLQAGQNYTESDGDTATWSNVQLELDAATDYEPYQGDGYTVQIGQTVCSGKMNWVTGELTVEYGYVELSGNEDIRVYGDLTNHPNTILIRNQLPNEEYRAEGVASHALVHKYLDTSGRIVIGNNSRGIYWVNALDVLGMTSAEEFIAWVKGQKAAGTPVQIAYKPSTPMVIQLTPQSISALYGVNTFYGNAGTIIVGYRTFRSADENDITISEHFSKYSDGHFWQIELGKMVKAPKRLCLHFAQDSACVYLNFYRRVNGEYVPDWTILGEGVNQLAYNSIPSHTIDIPDGTYMRAIVDRAAAGEVKLYGWDGVKFGPAVSGDLATTTEDGSEWIVLNAEGSSGITLPLDSKAIICTGNAAISAIWGVKTTPKFDFETVPQTHDVLYAGHTRFYEFPNEHKYKYFKMRFDPDYDFEKSKVNSVETVTGDLQDYVCVVRKTEHTRTAMGRGKKAIETARKICGIKWTPTADGITTSADGTRGFRKGVTYNGIPYASDYSRAQFIGYHVSLHTFLNAVNDPDSIIYHEKSSKNKSYYGLVCSTFTALACGWPVPVTNHGYLYDPDVAWHISDSPEIGAIWSDLSDVFVSGAAHCVIPERIDWDDDSYAITAYEGTAPQSMRTTRYKTITFGSLDGYGLAGGYSYYDKYGMVASYIGFHANDGVPYLDFNDTKLVNGSARPYKGDKSVYTSADEKVLINIKNADAVKLYLLKRGQSNTTEISISAGTTQVDVKAYLDGSGIYEVWADATGNVRESFEYVVVTPIKWTVTENSITFDRNDFYYAHCYMGGHPLFAEHDEQTEKQYYTGTPVLCSNDYSRWFEGGKRIKSVITIFGKGEYGAYVIPDVKG